MILMVLLVFHKWHREVPTSNYVFKSFLSLIFLFFIHFSGQSTDTPRGTGWAGKCSPAFTPCLLAVVDQTLHCHREGGSGKRRAVQCRPWGNWLFCCVQGCPGLVDCGALGYIFVGFQVAICPTGETPPAPPHLFITVFVNWHECCQRHHLSSSHILEWGRFCSWILLSNSIHCLFFFFSSFSLEQKSNWSSRGAHLIWIVFTKWSALSVRVSREVFAF